MMPRRISITTSGMPILRVSSAMTGDTAAMAATSTRVGIQA